MGRTVREARIHDRSARAKLKPRHHPYWRLLQQGFHLGYYRGRLVGKWVVRYRKPGAKTSYQIHQLGEADDISPADGVKVLSWSQASEQAHEWLKAARQRSYSNASKLTVLQALEPYMKRCDERVSKYAGRTVRSDQRQKLTRYVLSDDALAKTKLRILTDRDLRAWQRGLPDRKSATKRRIINDFKAALNAAYLENRAGLPADLLVNIKLGLKPIFDEDECDSVARENQVLPDDKVRAIVRKAAEQDADGDFARLVLALAATGARFAQLRRMQVGDVQPEQCRLLVPHSRKGRGIRHGHIRIPVDRDVIDKLLPAMAGRDPNAPLFERWRRKQTGPKQWEKVSRGPWSTASELTRRWNAIAKEVGVPDAVPYALRHSSIVRSLRNHLPIRLVAALHDTSVVMIERHYSRWITDQLDELAIRAVVSLS